jgi:WD40-like Beta Propeller Repeat
MNETQLRERLLDLAEAAPTGRPAPVDLIRRARRRVVLTVASAVLAAMLLIGIGIAGVRALQTMDPRPADDDAVESSLLPFSRVHGWIAFRDGDELVAVDPANPNERRSLGNSLGADPIAWSRDGTRLLLRPHPEIRPVFQAGEWWWGTAASSATMDMFVLDEDGSRTRITKGGGFDPESGTWGSFSPDGTQVAYASNGSSRGPYVVAVGGGDPRRLGDPCERAEIEGRSVELCGEPLPEWAAWSPDGTQIVWSDFVEDSETYGHHANVLSFVRPDGTGLRAEAVEMPGAAGGLVWSPDGSQLAFFMAVPDPEADPHVAGFGEGGDFPAQIFVMNADGSGLRQLTDEGDNRWPSWSPDGTRIAFARGEVSLKTARDGSRAAFVRPGTRQLFTIALDGTDVRRIDGITPDGPVAWNPVG